MTPPSAKSEPAVPDTDTPSATADGRAAGKRRAAESVGTSKRSLKRAAAAAAKAEGGDAKAARAAVRATFKSAKTDQATETADLAEPIAPDLAAPETEVTKPARARRSTRPAKATKAKSVSRSTTKAESKAATKPAASPKPKTRSRAAVAENPQAPLPEAAPIFSSIRRSASPSAAATETPALPEVADLPSLSAAPPASAQTEATLAPDALPDAPASLPFEIDADSHLPATEPQPVAAPAPQPAWAEETVAEPAVAALATQPASQAPTPALTTQPLPAPLPPLEGEVEDDEEEGERGGRRGRRRGRTLGKATDPSNYVVAPPVAPAQMRPRHYGVIVAFLLIAVLPTLSYSWYLWTRAADQYESNMGFGSRTEEGPSTFDFVGALTGASQTGSKDMDILNQFVISQELVAKVDAELDLRTMWSKAQGDPLNSFPPGGTIEDLVSFWQRMVLVEYDNGTGLMNLRVFAFDPVDAQAIAQAILRESTAIINQLSQTAQEDTTRYSREMLAETEAKLAAARLAVLDFQVKNNIVDPSNVVSNQLSVVASLNQELATAQVELDMLRGTVPEGDPRIATLTRRLEVIENRIAVERAKVGAASNPDQPGFASLIAEFEGLKVDQEFAQSAYNSARATYDQALADAQKKTRYLATYVAPTLAEAPTAPVRPVHAALAALVGFLIWSVSVLTYYALRDRR